MTFRDDHDAALARADALEGEVERTRRERDALAAKVKELEEQAKPGPKKTPTEKRRKDRRERKRLKAQRGAEPSPVTSSDDDTKGEKRAVWISMLGFVVVLGVMMAFGIRTGCAHDRALDDWDAKTAARQHHKDRWQAVISVEHCIRRIAFDSAMARSHTPDKEDPRVKFIWPFTDGIVGNCLSNTLLADPATSPAVKSALGKLMDVQAALVAPTKQLAVYYSDDWKEDNFARAPELWKPVLGLLERQVAAIEIIRRDVLPALRSEVREVLKAHEAKAGRDETYWRGALTVQLWEINDRSYEAAGIYAGRQPDDAAGAAAIKNQVVSFLALAKEAPIEVRREIRKLDWITDQIVAGGPLHGETPLWHFANAEDSLLGYGDHVPALPPDPGPRPHESD